MRTRWKICLLCLFIFGFVVPIGFTDEVAEKSKQLQQIKKDINKIRQQKTEVSNQKRSVQSELKRINKELAKKEKELKIYEAKLAESERQLAYLTAELRKAESQLSQSRELLYKRARMMYKSGYDMGNLGYIKLITKEEDDLNYLGNRYKYMNSIAMADKEVVDRSEDKRDKVDYNRRMVEAKKQEILSYKTELESVKKDIENKKSERQKLLDQVSKEERELINRLEALERSAAQLERLIAQLQAQNQQRSTRRASWSEEVISNFDSKSGMLPWPVSGRIIENASPSMSGVTIQAAYGTDVRCVEDGIVDYARMFDGVGYGQMIIINHGDGYRTLYSHLSTILVKEGQRVNKGQVIGKVGDTGSNRGPILYFEVWKGAKPLPARQWLSR